MPKPGFMGGTGGGMAAPQPGGPSVGQLDAALGMLSSAQQGMQGSTNPLLSFLMPIATGMIGKNLTTKRDTAQAQVAARMSDTLLGPNGMSPSAKAALDVMNSPDAPDYLKDIAKTMLTAATKPKGGGGGKSQPRLYGEAFEDVPGSGRWFKRDATGMYHELPMPGAPPAPAAAPLPPPPSQPAMPGDPSLTAPSLGQPVRPMAGGAAGASIDGYEIKELP